MADSLGKYRILAEIGKGGFATVYRALDPTLDREVALKVLDPILARDPAWVGRFQREAKAIARLKHPYVVSLEKMGSNRNSRGGYFKHGGQAQRTSESIATFGPGVCVKRLGVSQGVSRVPFGDQIRPRVQAGGRQPDRRIGERRERRPLGQCTHWQSLPRNLMQETHELLGNGDALRRQINKQRQNALLGCAIRDMQVCSRYHLSRSCSHCSVWWASCQRDESPQEVLA